MGVRIDRAGSGFFATVVLLVALWFGAGSAWGQAQNTGSIYGTVTDPSGALIPGAKVLAVEADKGIKRAGTANNDGDFNLPSLPVGVYTLTVTAAGFQTFVEDTITVDADKAVKVVAKLSLGNASEQVTVEGEGTALDTRSSTIGTLIDNKLVENLPIDGNNTVALAGLLPGVTDLNAPPTNTSDRGGPTYSVSGSRNTQNLMLFDGLMWNNLFYNTGINYPPRDGLQEISVLLNNFKAQYGRNAGSVFNVVTKSGSDVVHGAIWEYIQNQMFNAADYLTHENPKDISNQFGFTVGGPVVIPHVFNGHDKLFYQITFQDLIQHLQVIGTTPTPTAQERGLTASGAPFPCNPQGPFAGMSCADFSDFPVVVTSPTGQTSLSTISQQGSKFYNPEYESSSSGLEAQPFNAEQMLDSASVQAGGPAVNPCIAQLAYAGQWTTANNYRFPTPPGGTQPSPNVNYLPYYQIPADCLNPVISKVLATYVPLPNYESASGPENISVAPQPRNDKNALIRVDWKVNDHHAVDARYNLIDADDATAPGVNSSSVGIATYEISANHAVSNFGNIGETWTITPNILNVARLGYKRYTLVNPPLDPHTLNDFGGNFVEPGPPVMPVINTSDEFSLGSTGQAQASVVNENIELLDQLSWTHGTHSFQFGVNFLRLQYLNSSAYPGELQFSVTFTGVAPADEAMGLLDAVTAKSQLVQAGISHSIFSYAQDDWRVTPKMTLNLGVRYELPFQWFQPTGYSSTFIPGHQSTRFPGAIGGLAFPGDPGVLRSLVPTDFNGVVPRIGFAYDAFGTGRFVLRGGFGMFFDAINADVVGVGEPFYFQVYKTLPPGGASVPLATFGPNNSTLQLPTAFDPKNPQFFPPYSLFYPDRDFRTPYYEAMNFGFEQRIARGGMLDVNYVGKLGRKLTIPFDQNPAIYDCSGGYFQANPNLYCTNANSTAVSEAARLRYTPFNYGGSGLVDFASIGTSNYDSLQVQYTQRGGRLLTTIVSYTYSKAIDLQTQSESVNNSIPDVFNISSERGPSDYDARHVLNMGWVMNLPNATVGNAFTHAILDNWMYNGTFNAHTGKPFSVTINNDTALDDEPNQRAAMVPGQKPFLPKNRHRMAKVQQYLNPNAFTYPKIGTFSPVQRNSFYGPGYLMTNMSIGRYFPMPWVREGARLLFRAAAFNVFNTPNLANPNHNWSCSTTSTNGGSCSAVSGAFVNAQFGAIPSTYGNNANTSTNGRKMQFSMTLYF